MKVAIEIPRGERVTLCGRDFTAKQKLILCTESEYLWLGEGGAAPIPSLRERLLRAERTDPTQLEIEMEMLEPVQVEVKA